MLMLLLTLPKRREQLQQLAGCPLPGPWLGVLEETKLKKQGSREVRDGV